MPRSPTLLASLAILALTTGILLAGGRGTAPNTAPLSAGKPVTPTLHPAPLPPDMKDFKTTETCTTTTIAKSRANAAGIDEPGYLGVELKTDKGKIVIASIAPDSPAAKAGLATGDVLLSIDGHNPSDEDEFADRIHAAAPGTKVNLTLFRGSKQLTLPALLTAVSHPLSLAGDRAILGVQVNDSTAGARVLSVDPNSPAALARMQSGDLIVKVDDVTIGEASHLADVLASRKVGEVVNIVSQRNEQTASLRIELASADSTATGRGRGGTAAGGGSTYFDRIGQLWKKDTLKLALIGIDFLDMKHVPASTTKVWEDAFFSHGTYKQTATGQPAYGSEYDFYLEQSYGQLKLEGKMLRWAVVSKNRADYSQGSGTGQDRTLLAEVMNLVGADALAPYDGVIFIYAGARAVTNRGGVFWPHKSTFTMGTRRLPYVIIPEGGQRMSDISVPCHESGHILGLPDLYARPEDPGSEGLGSWCLMSQQVPGGRPQQMCAWSKEQLGWIKPTLIDPSVKQKLVLGPIEDSNKECYKILVRPDATEYFLLENRAQKGFDASLPSEGLLIWRVEGNRPSLVESHGIEGPAGPSNYPTQIPYPSSSNDSFTPFTTPSSRSRLGGGNQVYLTNIKRMSDGRISFWIGYDFQ